MNKKMHEREDDQEHKIRISKPNIIADNLPALLKQDPWSYFVDHLSLI